MKQNENILFCCTAADPQSVDLELLELPVLCDGLRRYLQDLPQPIIPAALCAQMVQAAKGERRRHTLSSNSSGSGGAMQHDIVYFKKPARHQQRSWKLFCSRLSFAFFFLPPPLPAALLSWVLHAQPRFSLCKALAHSGRGNVRNRISVVNSS